MILNTTFQNFVKLVELLNKNTHTIGVVVIAFPFPSEFINHFEIAPDSQFCFQSISLPFTNSPTFVLLLIKSHRTFLHHQIISVDSSQIATAHVHTKHSALIVAQAVQAHTQTQPGKHFP